MLPGGRSPPTVPSVQFSNEVKGPGRAGLLLAPGRACCVALDACRSSSAPGSAAERSRQRVFVHRCIQTLRRVGWAPLKQPGKKKKKVSDRHRTTMKSCTTTEVRLISTTELATDKQLSPTSCKPPPVEGSRERGR